MQSERWKDDDTWDGENGLLEPEDLDTDTQKDMGFTVRLTGTHIEGLAVTGRLQRSLISMPATGRISQKRLI